MESQSKGTILIVDDNAYNLEMLSRRLSRSGYETVAAESGYDALNHIQQQEFDVVLLDIMMPGMNGMEVLAEIRATYSKTTLPVIMVTSKGESEDVVGALSQGANDYIMKPVDFPVALARIQTQISQKKEFSSYSQTKITYSLKQGDRFGHYILKEKIGSGGMGAVYKIYDPNLDRIAALKVILPGNELTNAQIERFTREARAIARIKHPNIVTVYDIGEVPQYYFTMDFIEGENLSQVLKERRFQPKQTVEICLKLTSALHSAHGHGIVHRDLKPSNIMIDQTNEPHLMDFGLAKLDSEEEQITRTGDLLGTPEYMAPEQVDPNYGAINPLSDVYSLGAILYEMLSGQPPFSGTPIRILWQKLNEEPQKPSHFNDQLPAELDRICFKAMAREQQHRYPDAMAFEKDLKRLVF